MPLNHKLKTRDVIEILQEETENPKIEWLKFVQTNIAKDKISQWHRRLKVRNGWEIIKNNFGYNLETYKRQLEYAATKIPGCKGSNDLAYKLSSSDCNIEEIQMFMRDYDQEQRCSTLDCQNEQQPPLIGVEGYLWRIAICCHEFALPNEPLVGIRSTRKDSMSIHRKSCPNLNRIDTNKKVEVAWNCNYCLVTLQLQIKDRQDILRQLLNKLADKSIFLNLRSLTTYPDKTFRANFVAVVNSREQLEHIKKHIENSPEVKSIKIKNLIPGAIM